MRAHPELRPLCVHKLRLRSKCRFETLSMSQSYERSHPIVENQLGEIFRPQNQSAIIVYNL